MHELTTIEQGELEKHEQTIERGLKTFVDVGNALLSIRDGRLYRAEHGTFEVYCLERWGMQRAHAYRMIDAASTVNILSPIGDKMPANESQARPLTNLEPEQQRSVWQAVVEESQETGERITGKKVQEAVDRSVILNTGIDILGMPTHPAKHVHVSQNSGNNEWYTPSKFIDAARSVMGGIDCDPASSEIANRTVKAETYYTIETDGLSNPWHGRVWMNPPYAQPLIRQFCETLAEKYESGEITEACVLVNNASETGWFETLAKHAACRCDIKSRVKFVDVNGNPGGAPLQGQVVLYLGEKEVEFAEAFGELGRIWHAW